LIIKKKKIWIKRERERERKRKRGRKGRSNRDVSGRIEMSLEEYKLKRREVYGEALLQPRRQNHAMNETS